MKRRSLIILLLMVFLIGCSLHTEDYIYAEEIKEIVGDMQSIQDIELWMRYNLIYIADDGQEADSPYEMITKGGGDCEEFAITYLYLLDLYGFENASKDRVICVSMPEGLHAVVTVSFKDYLVSGEAPNTWILDDYTEIWSMKYEKYLWYCTANNTKNNSVQ